MDKKNRTQRGAESGKSGGRVSLADIAAEAGVSRMTASRVMRGATGFSEDTRDRVLAVAEQLGYVPDRIAASFGSEAANTLVGIALPTLARDLWASILEGLETRLSSAGYQPMMGLVGYDDELEHNWLMSTLAWRPSGIVVAGRERSEALRTVLQGLTIPVVEIWNIDPERTQQHKSDPVRVGFDHYQVGMSMGRYIASRYSGQFGYVGARPEGRTLGEGRLNGFIDAVREERSAQVTVKTMLLNDRSSFYAGYYGTEQLLSGSPDTRVIYYLDDAMAVGGLMLCQQRGLKIPGDVAIAGFGGLDIGSVLPMRLTTTAVQRLRIGKLAADNLVMRIDGKPVDARRDVGFELVKGATA